MTIILKLKLKAERLHLFLILWETADAIFTTIRNLNKNSERAFGVHFSALTRKDKIMERTITLSPEAIYHLKDIRKDLKSYRKVIRKMMKTVIYQSCDGLYDTKQGMDDLIFLHHLLDTVDSLEKKGDKCSSGQR